MSENRALFEEGVAAYNRGDLAFVLERAADDIDVYAAPGLVNSGSYSGPAAFARWMQDWVEAWSEFSLEVRSLDEVDDRFLLVDVHQTGTGRESGIPVEMDIVQLVEARDGEIARFHLYPDRAQAEQTLARLRQ